MQQSVDKTTSGAGQARLYKSEFDDGKKQVERASRGIGKSDDTPGFVQSRVQRQCKTEF